MAVSVSIISNVTVTVTGAPPLVCSFGANKRWWDRSTWEPHPTHAFSSGAPLRCVASPTASAACHRPHQTRRPLPHWNPGNTLAAAVAPYPPAVQLQEWAVKPCCVCGWRSIHHFPFPGPRWRGDRRPGITSAATASPTAHLQFFKHHRLTDTAGPTAARSAKTHLRGARPVFSVCGRTNEPAPRRTLKCLSPHRGQGGSSCHVGSGALPGPVRWTMYPSFFLVLLLLLLLLVLAHHTNKHTSYHVRTCCRYRRAIYLLHL